MKAVGQLDSPTPGMTDYLSQEQSQPTFRKFHDYDNGSAYRELRDTLAETQHGLCGYCEINLLKDDLQIEHFIPQSAGEEGQRRAVDHSNMIACCKGGDQANLFGTDTACPDSERYIVPMKKSRSCGTARGNTVSPDLIDPRTLPPLPSLFRVQIDGRIVPDPRACAQHGIQESRVERTIEILALNVRRLKANRAAKWENLNEVWGEDLNDPHMAELAAKTELLPDAAGQLPKYFTTSRSYFSATGENVLAREPKSWI